MLARICLFLVLFATVATCSVSFADTIDGPSTIVTLDGNDWLLATDPQNVGRQQQWFNAPRPEAKPTEVPWIIQEPFPGYHGVAWYWRNFKAPQNPNSEGRYLIRFWAVDYLAEVWLNGRPVGSHEGGETPFTLDVTDAIKPGKENRLAVRVLNPTIEPIDGITLKQTPRQAKEIPYRAGGAFNHGGIMDSVELLVAPPVRIEDLCVRPDPKTGIIRIEANIRNAAKQSAQGRIEFTVAPASSGPTLAFSVARRDLPVGDTLVAGQLRVENPRLWDVDDPILYRVTARVRTDGSDAVDESSTRCGFRDFRFENGYFRLNGRRIYLRSAHTCNHFPIGLRLPRDPDLLRRDFLNMKVMGFNSIRFIWGGSMRSQLDLCDEIGLMVYNESHAALPMQDSPKMAERFDRAVGELIRRDRNHPSIVIWGLLNETPLGSVHSHALGMLPLVRSLDETRLVMFSSGRWDLLGGGGGIGGVPGLRLWPTHNPTEPWAGVNATDKTVKALGITWPSKHLALHPGPKNEYSAVRWTAPAAGQIAIEAKFVGLADKATTDVHVLHNGHALFDAVLNLNESGNEAQFSKTITVAPGDRIDCVVGSGNGSYGGDTTGLALTIKTADKTFDAAAEFDTAANPNGNWSYGRMTPAATPDAASFAAYSDKKPSSPTAGSLSNPGTTEWQDILADQHYYPRVPQTAAATGHLRHAGAGAQPIYLTEYGIGSAVDLWRATRHFEQRRAERLEDAQFFNDKLNRFLADWKQWQLADTFNRPEDFFMESLRKMAGQRTLGLNAIRSNPNIIGYSLTGAIDHVMCGEGLTTLFRELKPGTIDAIFDGWAPLRWCLFAEPANIYRKSKVHVEAVLANEDVLLPGDYPARLQVIGPNNTPVFDQTVTVTIPKLDSRKEAPLATKYFEEDILIDGPAGEYQFLATFERGAAAAGGKAVFHLADPAEMPPVETEVVLWGEDPALAKWLADHGIRTRPFASTTPTTREVILASNQPGTPEAFRELARRMARGSTVCSSRPRSLRKGINQPAACLWSTRAGLAPSTAGSISKTNGQNATRSSTDCRRAD